MVDQAHAQGFLRAHVAAAEHQVQRGLGAHQTRGALRAARSRQQAQLHFRQAQLGRGRGHAVMRGHGHLHPTTQRRAVDGGHHGLGAGLDGVADIGQGRGQRRQAEFADVGASDEGLALAHDQHSVHIGIRLGLRDGLLQAATYRHAQRVDGRVVDHDLGNVVLDAVVNGLLCRVVLVHGGSSVRRPARWPCVRR
jgi:hypothetical protein